MAEERVEQKIFFDARSTDEVPAKGDVSLARSSGRVSYTRIPAKQTPDDYTPGVIAWFEGTSERPDLPDKKVTVTEYYGLRENRQEGIVPVVEGSREHPEAPTVYRKVFGAKDATAMYESVQNKTVRRIVIPEGVKRLGRTFDGCSVLRAVICLSSVPPAIASATFEGCHKQLRAYIPAGSREAYMQNPEWKKLEIVELK